MTAAIASLLTIARLELAQTHRDARAGGATLAEAIVAGGAAFDAVIAHSLPPVPCFVDAATARLDDLLAAAARNVPPAPVASRSCEDR